MHCNLTYSNMGFFFFFLLFLLFTLCIITYQNVICRGSDCFPHLDQQRWIISVETWINWLIHGHTRTHTHTHEHTERGCHKKWQSYVSCKHTCGLLSALDAAMTQRVQGGLFSHTLINTTEGKILKDTSVQLCGAVICTHAPLSWNASHLTFTRTVSRAFKSPRWSKLVPSPDNE